MLIFNLKRTFKKKHKFDYSVVGKHVRREIVKMFLSAACSRGSWYRAFANLAKFRYFWHTSRYKSHSLRNLYIKKNIEAEQSLLCPAASSQSFCFPSIVTTCRLKCRNAVVFCVSLTVTRGVLRQAEGADWGSLKARSWGQFLDLRWGGEWHKDRSNCIRRNFMANKLAQRLMQPCSWVLLGRYPTHRLSALLPNRASLNER